MLEVAWASSSEGSKGCPGGAGEACEGDGLDRATGREEETNGWMVQKKERVAGRWEKQKEERETEGDRAVPGPRVVWGCPPHSGPPAPLTLRGVKLVQQKGHLGPNQLLAFMLSHAQLTQSECGDLPQLFPTLPIGEEDPCAEGESWEGGEA